ncbi:MAG: hypothetical protein ACO2PL_07250 [Armatimonadota bacterium]
MWFKSCELGFSPERTICNSQLFRYQPASAGFVNIDADLKRGVGRGTRDGMNLEGEAPAKPNLSANREIGKRQRVANGE